MINLKSKEFKIFITVWLVYIFYLQMYGSSCMANSQSALAAAIVNERRFEVDTYKNVSCDLAFYNGHYYSGMAPGVSFISVPLYILSKPMLYILPQEATDFLFERLENYGNTLPSDFWGNKKILSNYFSGLGKRQILEYVIISGFVLPIFTTALISAISAVLLYMLLKRFTGDDRLRLLITFFYAFGTITFPISTEFFQRPIAAALMFAAFFILFKLRHKELEPRGSALFGAGVLAGLSALFDYFYLFAAPLLFLYMLYPYADGPIKAKNIWKWPIFGLDKKKLLLLLKFSIGASIPILLLFMYQYAIFDNFFSTTYYHRAYLIAEGTVQELYKKSLPEKDTTSLGLLVFHILELFLYSPILILALYGLYKALRKKDRYYTDAVSAAIFAAFTLIFILGLVLFFHSGIGPSIKRYMSPMILYLMLFLPYIFPRNMLPKKNKAAFLFIFIGVISIFANWTSAQFGGHWALTHFNLKGSRFQIIEQFFENGPSSSFLNALAGVFGMNPLVLNIIGLLALIFILAVIWSPFRHYSNRGNKH